ncbi:hypothetical protein QQ045_013190 [Rhodiola kirilowii]
MLANKHLNTKYIADEIAKAMSRFSAREIHANIRRDYEYEISYLKAVVDSSPETFVKWDRTPLDNGASQVNLVFWAFA